MQTPLLALLALTRPTTPLEVAAQCLDLDYKNTSCIAEGLVGV